MTDQPWVAPGSGGAPGAGSGPSGPASQPGQVPVGPPPVTPPPPGQAPPASGPPPGWSPPPYARAEFRPGIVPLRPLTLGDLYGGVLKAVRGNPGATIGLATVTTFAFLLPATALGTVLAGTSSLALDDSSGAASDTLPEGFGTGLLGTYLPSIGQALSAILLAGFLAAVVSQAVLGRLVTMGETWRATRGRVPAMVGAVAVTILAFLGIIVVAVGIPVGIIVYAESAGGRSIPLYVLVGLVGLLALVAASLWLSTIWAFATPAIVIERAGVFGGLARSARLVGGPFAGPFWRVFGIRLLTSLLVGTASSVVTFPIALLIVFVGMLVVGESGDGSEVLVLQTVASGIAGLVVGALTTPFTAGVDALLYVDARMRREGLDVQLVQAAQGAGPAPWAVTSPT